MKKISNEDLMRPSVEEFAQMDKLPIVVVLDNVRSAQNVGAFFRTSDAFAISRLALCGISPCPPSRDIHKSALGAEMTVEWEHYPTSEDCVQVLRKEGYKIFAIEQVEGAVMLDKMTFEKGEKYALIFGNEVMGVEQNIVDMADGAIEIPQSGTKHSINVSVAGGVVLWSAYQSMKMK